jgi:hypothetical protein
MTPSRRNAVLAILAGSLLMTAPAARLTTAPGPGMTFPPPGPEILAPHSSDAVFATLLARAESSGDPKQLNKWGYAGLFQLGESAASIAGLYDPGEPMAADDTRNRWRGTFHIPGYPEVRSIGDFLDTPAAQLEAFRLHLDHLDGEIARRGLDRQIGQYVAGVPITWDGLRAMMHLGGPDGTERFIATAGAYDPADTNGMHISDYGRRFAGVVAIQPTKPAITPTVATPAGITPTLVATPAGARTVPRRTPPPERQRGARGRPLPTRRDGPYRRSGRISASRTGSSCGRRTCRTSYARPRASRG